MKKYLIIIISLLQYTTNAQSNDCLKSFSENKWNILISLKLHETEMERFKTEARKLKWKYLNIDVVLTLITLPDKKGNLNFDCNFPSFTQDKYTYFYPKTDCHYYLPNNFSSTITSISEDNVIEIDLEEFKTIVAYITQDIDSKKDINKFEYYFADKREETYKSKEFRGSATIYNKKSEIVGRVHKFIGSHRTFTGHTDCEKIDYCRITIYNSPHDKIYYLNLKNLKNNSTLPIKEGKVFLSKRPIDLLRLEYCTLYSLMYDYAKKHNGTISLSLI